MLLCRHSNDIANRNRTQLATIDARRRSNHRKMDFIAQSAVTTANSLHHGILCASIYIFYLLTSLINDNVCYCFIINLFHEVLFLDFTSAWLQPNLTYSFCLSRYVNCYLCYYFQLLYLIAANQLNNYL